MAGILNIKDGNQWTSILSIKGDKGDRGERGERGEKGDAGQGVASGGSIGQILAKRSNTDYDTSWVDPQAELCIITVSGTSTLSADKTYEEITTDYQAGKILVVKNNNDVYVFSKFENNKYIFNKTDRNSSGSAQIIEVTEIEISSSGINKISAVVENTEILTLDMAYDDVSEKKYLNADASNLYATLNGTGRKAVCVVDNIDSQTEVEHKYIYRASSVTENNVTTYTFYLQKFGDDKKASVEVYKALSTGDGYPQYDSNIAPSAMPSGGTTGQVLTKSSNADGAVAWSNVPKEIPAGGSAGQTLIKGSSTDGDVSWGNEFFIVDINRNNNSYSTTKTASEIRNAITGGKIVLAEFNNSDTVYKNIPLKNYVANYSSGNDAAQFINTKDFYYFSDGMNPANKYVSGDKFTLYLSQTTSSVTVSRREVNIWQYMPPRPIETYEENSNYFLNTYIDQAQDYQEAQNLAGTPVDLSVFDDYPSGYEADGVGHVGVVLGWQDVLTGTSEITQTRYVYVSDKTKIYVFAAEMFLEENPMLVDTIDLAGSSVPSGGTTGQVLMKSSDSDGAVVWSNETYVIPTTRNGSSYSTTKTVTEILDAYNSGKHLVISVPDSSTTSTRSIYFPLTQFEDNKNYSPKYTLYFYSLTDVWGTGNSGSYVHFRGMAINLDTTSNRVLISQRGSLSYYVPSDIQTTYQYDYNQSDDYQYLENGYGASMKIGELVDFSILYPVPSTDEWNSYWNSDFDNYGVIVGKQEVVISEYNEYDEQYEYNSYYDWYVLRFDNDKQYIHIFRSPQGSWDYTETRERAIVEIGGGGVQNIVAKITGSVNNLVSDKTFAELKQAILDGNVVSCTYNSDLYVLNNYPSSGSSQLRFKHISDSFTGALTINYIQIKTITISNSSITYSSRQVADRPDLVLQVFTDLELNKLRLNITPNRYYDYIGRSTDINSGRVGNILVRVNEWNDEPVDTPIKYAYYKEVVENNETITKVYVYVDHLENGRFITHIFSGNAFDYEAECMYEEGTIDPVQQVIDNIPSASGVSF